MKHELGVTLRDCITGFEGINNGYVKYLTGCNQYLLVAKATDGKLGESQWFDEQRCERVGTNKIILDNGKTPGGDLAPHR